MRNIYTREIKDMAKALHFQGECFASIARKIGCAPETVSKWSKEEKWQEERIKIYAESAALGNQKASVLFSDRFTQQVQAYQEMLTKGTQALQQVEVKSAREASQMIEKAIKGMGAIREDTLPLAFVEEIIAVIKSEIADRDLLCRIGERLREVYEKYRHNRRSKPTNNSHYPSVRRLNTDIEICHT